METGISSDQKDTCENSGNFGRWDRAQKLVDALSVKLHRFEPSRREVWTVVGREGDFLVDYNPSSEKGSYCSCNDFHFRVLSGAVPVCYHLIAVALAHSQGQFSVIEFGDDEYDSFIRALVADLFARL